MNTQKLNQLRSELSNEVERQAMELLNTSDEVGAFKRKLEEFSDDPYIKGSERQFNEYGDFESVIRIDASFKDSIDSEVFDALLETLNDNLCVYLKIDGDEVIASQRLGETVTINFSDPRGCYAVHSRELGLKVDYSDLIGDDDSEKLDHALALIEVAMRKHGYHPIS